MIIDFHTHVFPDQLAPRALATMTKNIDNIYPPVTDMTVKGLLSNMDKWNIDISVVQPVITKAAQITNANKFAQSICSDRIISFGGIYPHTDDYKRDIDYVVSLGLKGLKFHAEYQDFVLDDPYMLKIYDYAFSKGLIILHHAGFDPAMPAPFKSDPKRFAHVVDEMKGGILIAAHFGGHAQWDDVERYLVGKNIYLDTSMGSQYYKKDQFLRIVKAHGADRILFASDSPWSDAGIEIEYMNSLPLPKEDIQKILGANAKRLLGI
jgi:hypothetical protein